GVAYFNAAGDGPTANAAPLTVTGPPQWQASNIAYYWVEISGTGTNTLINGDDQNLGPFPMGASFPWWDGTTITQMRVCSNGWISPTSTLTTYVNTTLPTTTTPNDALYMLWDDLNPSRPESGDVWYHYDAANQRWILEFDNVCSYTSPYTLQKFEAIFYQAGYIDLLYHTIAAPSLNSNTVGIENSAGTDAVLCAFNGAGPYNPVSNYGIRISPAGGVTHTTEITLTPIGAPIVVPAVGGSFNYNANLHNTGTSTDDINVWVMIQLPTGTWYGPALGPLTLSMPAGANITRERIQNIPGTAPAGNYWYQGRVGTYPDISDSSGFAFSKSATDFSGSYVGDWANYGESFELYETVQAPAEFALVSAYPNPFNPTATISFTLPEASQVTLKVYDLSGRLVGTLVDGWRNVGSHQAVFDGTGLASGIYVYSLTSGAQTLTGKMVMMK
ncbi:MAG: T9SS C-terminal target domain-containing protein, partial [Candidatus Zixiibacteriota bacterium]